MFDLIFGNKAVLVPAIIVMTIISEGSSLSKESVQ